MTLPPRPSRSRRPVRAVRADVRSYGHAVLMLNPADPGRWIDVIGDHEDVFVRTAAGWRISRRVSRTARRLTSAADVTGGPAGGDRTTNRPAGPVRARSERGEPTMDSVALPGVVRQIGYVVRDLDQAIASWLSLGVGPWYVLRGQRQPGIYRDQPCEVTLSVAFGNSGDLQIELILQEDETPSIYTEFLASGREGFHQLAWWASDFEATMTSVREAGWPIVWSGGEGGSTRYAYLEPTDGPAAIIEIMELTAGTSGLAALVRAAAADWDGRDPIRSLPTGR